MPDVSFIKNIKVSPKNVVLLVGSWNAEREVSLSSGQGIEKALKKLGHTVRVVDINRDIASLVHELTSPRPDVVCTTALHGRWMEDGCLQGLLELLDLPYTHSGVLASSIAMNKAMTRRICLSEGIPVAPGEVLNLNVYQEGKYASIPHVVKPLHEGSSVGIHLMKEGGLCPYINDNWPFGSEVLVEHYIPGREIQVAVIGGKAIGAIEIIPKNEFYDYEAKYTDGKADHIMPAPLAHDALSEALKLSEKLYKAIGCRGLVRTDFMYNGSFYLLETNPQPGMTPLSLAPEILGHYGVSFEEMIQWIIEDASTQR